MPTINVWTKTRRLFRVIRAWFTRKKTLHTDQNSNEHRKYVGVVYALDTGPQNVVATYVLDVHRYCTS